MLVCYLGPSQELTLNCTLESANLGVNHGQFSVY